MYGVTKDRTEYNKNSTEDACVRAKHDVGKYTPMIGVHIYSQNAFFLFFITQWT
jgi:hypothetical protein